MLVWVSVHQLSAMCFLLPCFFLFLWVWRAQPSLARVLLCKSSLKPGAELQQQQKHIKEDIDQPPRWFKYKCNSLYCLVKNIHTHALCARVGLSWVFFIEEGANSVWFCFSFFFFRFLLVVGSSSPPSPVPLEWLSWTGGEGREMPHSRKKRKRERRLKNSVGPALLQVFFFFFSCFTRKENQKREPNKEKKEQVARLSLSLSAGFFAQQRERKKEVCLLPMPLWTSNQARLPAELKHINKRRKRN